MNQKTLQHKGFVLLTSILILGMVGVLIAGFISLMAIDSTKNELDSYTHNQALFLAEGCIERGLYSIYNDKNFNDSFTFSFSGGVCTGEVIDLGGENRELRSTGTYKDEFYRIRVVISSLEPKIQIASWERVASF